MIDLILKYMTDSKIHYLADEFRSHAELFKSLAKKLETKGALEAIERDLVLDIFKRSYASVMLFPIIDITDSEQFNKNKEEEADKIEEVHISLFSTSELDSAFSQIPGFEGKAFTEKKEVKEEEKPEEVEFELELEVVKPAAEPVVAEVEVNEPVATPITTIEESLVVEKPEENATEPITNQAVEEKKKHSTTEKKKSLAEQFTYPPALHEALSKVLANKNLSAVLASRPISNLASGITLNDKFLFIRELFDGNNIMYEDVISQIDNSHSLSEAMHIVGRSVQNIDFESGAAHKFIEIIHRRFSGY